MRRALALAALLPVAAGLDSGNVLHDECVGKCDGCAVTIALSRGAS